MNEIKINIETKDYIINNSINILKTLENLNL